MRIGVLPWPLTAVESHSVSSQTGGITTTINRVFVHSEEPSAWSTALSMFSGLHSRLAMHELAQRKRKELMAAPKVSSSGKAGQYVIPQVIEHLGGC